MTESTIPALFRQSGSWTPPLKLGSVLHLLLHLHFSAAVTAHTAQAEQSVIYPERASLVLYLGILGSQKALEAFEHGAKGGRLGLADVDGLQLVYLRFDAGNLMLELGFLGPQCLWGGLREGGKGKAAHGW